MKTIMITLFLLFASAYSATLPVCAENETSYASETLYEESDIAEKCDQTMDEKECLNTEGMVMLSSEKGILQWSFTSYIPSPRNERNQKPPRIS